MRGELITSTLPKGCETESEHFLVIVFGRKYIG